MKRWFRRRERLPVNTIEVKPGSIIRFTYDGEVFREDVMVSFGIDSKGSSMHTEEAGHYFSRRRYNG